MRFALLLALASLACAADPVLLPDAGPCSSACGAGTVCQAGACVAVDAGGSDVVAVADQGADAPAVVDRPTAMDTPVAVADAGADAGSDGGVDVPAVDGGVCPNGRAAQCDGRNVMLTTGERDGGAGLTFFCGACSGPGSVCAADEGCVSCRCQR